MSHLNTIAPTGRGNVFHPRCPSRVVLKHLTNTWGILTVLALAPGTLRFSEIRSKVGGISERMLAQTLKELEADGVLVRKSYPVVPPRVEYTLTDFGLEAARRLVALSDWIEEQIPVLLRRRADQIGPRAIPE